MPMGLKRAQAHGGGNRTPKDPVLPLNLKNTTSVEGMTMLQRKASTSELEDIEIEIFKLKHREEKAWKV